MSLLAVVQFFIYFLISLTRAPVEHHNLGVFQVWIQHALSENLKIPTNKSWAGTTKGVEEKGARREKKKRKPERL